MGVISNTYLTCTIEIQTKDLSLSMYLKERRENKKDMIVLVLMTLVSTTNVNNNK